MHSGKSQMMKCCDKAKKKEKTPEAKAAQLCCVFNCNNSAPTSSSSTFNFSPTAISIRDSISKQISLQLKKERVILTVSFSFERKTFARCGEVACLLSTILGCQVGFTRQLFGG